MSIFTLPISSPYFDLFLDFYFHVLRCVYWGHTHWVYGLSYYYFSCLTAFPLSSSISPIINFLTLLFETQRKTWRPKLFLQTRNREHKMRGGGRLNHQEGLQGLQCLRVTFIFFWTQVRNSYFDSVSPQSSINNFIAPCLLKLLKISSFCWFLLIYWCLYIIYFSLTIKKLNTWNLLEYRVLKIWRFHCPFSSTKKLSSIVCSFL